MSNHPAKLEQGDDEDYVDYIGRQADSWLDNPPPAPDGFELIPCEHEPRHWPTYTVADDDFYPAYCQEDLIPKLYRRIDELEHKGHWFRWRGWHRVFGWLYSLGVISSSGSRWNAYCNGCTTHIGWRGKRPYILGLSRQQWTCLRHGHRYRPLIDCGLCAICLPCPDCGSTEADHWYGICKEAS